MLRRSFLKTASATALIPLSTYAEKYENISDNGGWIEDKGDYCIIRVPDFKSFSNEVIKKPAILILGTEAKCHDVSFYGFLNVFYKNNSVIDRVLVDSKGKTMTNREHFVICKSEKEGDKFTLSNSHFNRDKRDPNEYFLSFER